MEMMEDSGMAILQTVPCHVAHANRCLPSASSSLPAIACWVACLYTALSGHWATSSWVPIP